MAEQPWFKVWAKSSLGSLDLQSLTDHEERVWWRLLCVASVAEPRWLVDMPIEGLARSCASTPPKLRAALARLESQGMVIRTDAGWLISNAEKYQETPEAARQRRKRERDKQRDMSRNESRPQSRQEVRGQRLDPSEDKSSSGGDAPKRTRKPSKEVTPLTPEEIERLRQKWREKVDDVDGSLEMATAHEAHLKYPDNQFAYADGWLRREAKWNAERTSHGRNNHNPARDPAEIAGLADY